MRQQSSMEQNKQTAMLSVAGIKLDLMKKAEMHKIFLCPIKLVDVDSFLTYPESAGMMGVCDPYCVVQNMLHSYHQENFCDNSVENNDKGQGPDCRVQIATGHHITRSC